MSKASSFLLPLTVSLWLAVSLAHSQENYEVRGLEFTGNTTLSDDRLKAGMTTYATGRLQRWFGAETFLFSEEILRADLTGLVRRYQKEGFLYARAEVAGLEVNDRSRSVGINIAITEGDWITVREVLWTPADSSVYIAPRVDSVLQSTFLSTEVRAGIRFRDAAVEADRRMLVRALEDQGYPYCEAVPVVSVVESLLVADVVWHIRPGPRCRFGEINVAGNAHVGDKHILRTLVLRPGETYSRRRLEESQRRIYDLALFHVVTVTATLTAERDSIIPVEVSVKEAPRLTTKIGGGYGREEKFRAYSDSYVLRFLGGTRRLNLFLKHSDLEPYRISLKLIQPAFLTRRTILEINPFLLRQEEPAYTENRYGSHLSLLHQITQHLLGSVTYSYERVDLDTTSLADVDVDGDQLADLYNKSSILFGITFDNSTPMFSPARGIWAASAFKISGLGLGSDYHFTRALWEIRRYQPLLGMVLAGRVKIGGIKSTDEHGIVPVEDRFYAGGSASVRGWPRSELGPIVDDTPVGGKSLLEASMEWRYPIIGIVSGAVFSDFGNVWSPSYVYHLDDMRYSAGFGVRVRTPIGPVRLDVARPVFDDETTWQVHISVGEAF